MKISAQRLAQLLPVPVRILLAALLFAAVPSLTPLATAQAPAPRIAGEVNGAERAMLPNSQNPRAQAKYDAGRLAGSTRLQGISLYFNRSQAQEADLKTLMAAQQNQASPLYHQWLTPDQFATRFGMNDADLAKVQSWLEQEGFSVDSVARSKNMIRFTGTVAQVESAFSTEMDTYNVPTAQGIEKHFAPSKALSVPSALAGVVLAVRNLDDFRPKPHFVPSKSIRPKPSFTGTDGYVFFAPEDTAVQYNVKSEYQAGYTGTGQSIAVVGQSEIELSDIENFQSAAGLSVKDPTLLLVPASGSPAFSAGDWTESDLDLEWSGAIGQNANITLVYVGSNSNYSAFDALQYAVDQKIANIVSSSYGECEAYLPGSGLASGAPLESTLESAFEQAATQGQTVMSAAGDDGSSDCFLNETGNDYPSLSAQEVAAVDYPGSSQYVLSVGGTEALGGDELNSSGGTNNPLLTPGGGYWESVGSSDEVTSLLKPFAEQAWNEDTTCVQYVSSTSSPLCAGGGGASTLYTSKPSWQANVPGIPADNARDVPDISLNASILAPGYLLCTSDTSDWETDQQSSCTSGFRDSATGDLTEAGGTSFAAPIFAGMLSLINQQQGYTTGQGLINPTLYKLASTPSTYASAFNDINTGNNYCLAGSHYCSGAAVTEFAAGVGYDQATGLGTVNLANLAAAWPVNTGSGAGLISTTTTVSASSTTPVVGANDTFTITITPGSGTTAPTGTVNITVDLNAAVTQTLAASGSAGVVTYTTSFSTAGTHTITVQYPGDSTFAASTGSISVTASAVSSGSGTFTLTSSPSPLTVTDGSSGTSTITATPAAGYTGTVDLSLDTSNDTALQNICWEFTNQNSSGEGTIAVIGTAAVTTQLTIYTSASFCATEGAVRKNGKQALHTLPRVNSASNNGATGTKTAPVAIAFAGLLLAGFLGRYSRKFRTMAGVIALVAVGLAVSACGGNGISTALNNPPAGSYTVTVTGQDSTSATIPTASTSFTFTIQ